MNSVETAVDLIWSGSKLGEGCEIWVPGRGRISGSGRISTKSILNLGGNLGLGSGSEVTPRRIGFEVEDRRNLAESQ